MDIMIKLLKTSFRNITNLPQCVAAARFYHVTCYKNYNLKSLPDLNSNEDRILKTMTKLESPNRIITCIESNAEYITGRHIVVALAAVQKCYSKKFNDNSNRSSERSSFEKLCSVLKPQLGKLKLQDAILSLDYLSKLRVPQNNDILCFLVNYIMKSTDQLTIYETITANKAIMKLDPSSKLIPSLRNSFVNNLFTKLDKENINELKLALMYTSKEVKDSHVIAYIIEALNNYRGQISPVVAFAILKSFCVMMHQPPGYLDLLHRVQSILTENTNGLSGDQMVSLISSLTSKVNEAHDEFYNETLLDNITERLISENVNFDRACYVLKLLCKTRHVQVGLLDYLSAKCFEHPGVLKNCEPSSMLSFVTGLAAADYKPAFWDAIWKYILNSSAVNYDSVTLCYFTLQLACLDSYDPVLLEKVFTARYKLKETPLNVWWTLNRLYQSVKALYPEYQGPWPNESVLNKLKSLSSQTSFPLLSALTQALGGSSYILSDVRTKHGQYIDHVIVLRKGGYPISINSDILESAKYLEDVPKPAESKIITILYMRPQWYARNTKKLLSPFGQSIKILEALSSGVITINSSAWNEMSANERIPYLMRAIRLKSEDAFDSV